MEKHFIMCCFFISAATIIVSADVINITESNYAINGYCHYYNPYDPGNQSRYESYTLNGTDPLANSTTFSASSAGLYSITNYSYSNCLGHAHDIILSEADASSMYIFNPIGDGIFSFDISGNMSWSFFDHDGYPDQYLHFLLTDNSTGVTLIDKNYFAEAEKIEYNGNVYNLPGTQDISDNVELLMSGTHQYAMSISGKVNGYNYSSLLTQSQNLNVSVGLVQAPEPSSKAFLGFGILSLVSLGCIRGRKIFFK